MARVKDGEHGKLGKWKIGNMKDRGGKRGRCRRWRTWKIGNVEDGERGRWGTWKMRNVEDEERGR